MCEYMHLYRNSSTLNCMRLSHTGMSLHIGFYGRKGSFNMSKPQDVAVNSTFNYRLEGVSKFYLSCGFIFFGTEGL
jgi:hypothetical protein